MFMAAQREFWETHAFLFELRDDWADDATSDPEEDVIRETAIGEID